MNFALLLSGRFVSDLGSSIQILVMPLFILDVGGTAKTIGLFSFLYILPILVIFPFGGVIGDRFNRKRIMVLADALSGLVVLTMAYFSYMGRLSLPLLLGFQVLVSMFYGFFDPASKGMIPQLVEKNKLSKANSKLASFRIIAGVLSPVVAVSMYSQFGMTTLFVINGLSFLVSSFSEMFIQYSHMSDNTKVSPKSILSDLREGIRYIKSAKIIFSLCIFFLISYAFIHPLFSVVLPIFFRSVLSYSDTYYGYLQMILFSGALVGSILAGVLSRNGNQKGVLTFGISLTGLAVLLYAGMLHPNVVNSFESSSLLYFCLLAFTMFLLYTSVMLVGIPMQTLIQSRTPKDYMSRVFSIVSLITKGGAPLGALIYGMIVDYVEIHVSALVIAFITATICLKYVVSFKSISEI